ncbi:MAG: class A beta-lactamase-related serine hydrolase [Firmicutes bacterium]|nr:class A beta-lactamase-related serine hydrolase [Bacillota bacterium]
MNKSWAWQRIQSVIGRFTGHVGFYAEHMMSHDSLSYDSQIVMETASVIKIPIMAAAFQYLVDRNESWETPLRIEPEDIVEGSGILRHLSPGLSLPILDVITLMIIVSDNTATNMILRLVGLDTVNHFITQHGGLAETKLMKRVDFSIPGPLGLSTARDMATLLTRLYQRTLVSAQASQAMWKILTQQQYNTIMTRDLPYDWITEEGESPPAVRIGSKSGSLQGVRNDVGIVTTPWGDYVVAILSEKAKDLRFHVDNEALVILPELSRIIFDYFTQSAPQP